MEWIDRLQGQVVGLDTAPLIYWIEEKPTYLEMVDAFFEALARGEFRVVTSMVTVLEVLVQPIRRGDNELAERYRNTLLDSPGLKAIEVTEDIADAAALLRSISNMQSLDAIQIATAIDEGASFFFTNDTRLPSFPGLELLVLDELIGAE